MPARIIAVQAIVVSILLVVVYVTILKPDDEHRLVGIDAPQGPDGELDGGGVGEPGGGDGGPGGGPAPGGAPAAPDSIPGDVIAAINALLGAEGGDPGAPGFAAGPGQVPSGQGDGGEFNEWGPGEGEGESENGGNGDPADGGDGGSPTDDQYSDAVARLISGLDQKP